jgi:hypothetical protein
MVIVANRLTQTAEKLIELYQHEVVLATQLANTKVNAVDPSIVDMSNADISVVVDGSVHECVDTESKEGEPMDISTEGQHQSFTRLIPEGAKVLGRLVAGLPFYLVKRPKYESSLEMVRSLELETTFKVRVLIDGVQLNRSVMLHSNLSTVCLFLLTTFLCIGCDYRS